MTPGSARGKRVVGDKKERLSINRQAAMDAGLSWKDGPRPLNESSLKGSPTTGAMPILVPQSCIAPKDAYGYETYYQLSCNHPTGIDEPFYDHPRADRNNCI